MRGLYDKKFGSRPKPAPDLHPRPNVIELPNRAHRWPDNLDITFLAIYIELRLNPEYMTLAENLLCSLHKTKGP